MTYKEEIEIPEKKLKRKTIFSFAVFILLAIASVVGWGKLHRQPQEAGALKPLRTILNYDESFFSNFFNDDHLAKTFPLSKQCAM